MAAAAAPCIGNSGGAAAATARRSWGPSPAATLRPAQTHMQPAAARETADADTHSMPTSRSRLLRNLAVGTLVGAAVAASSFTPPAAAAGEEPAERAAAAARGGVVSVAAIASGKGAAAGVQQIGSGIVWDEEGHIAVPYAPLTRVDRQGTAGPAQVLVTVQAADGRSIELPAAVVARDPSHELAVLLVELPVGGAGLLRPLHLASSAALRVGQDALLLAALPGGIPSVAAGVVSAVGRVIPASNNQAIPGVVQTDAEVNALSLGGALVDSGGRLVGMPVVSYAKPGVFRSSGVNFALPSDLILEVVPQLIVYHSAQARR